MSFLIFNEKTQEVVLQPEAKNLVEIRTLRNNDTSEDKSYLANSLKFIYHTYKKEHIFSNLSINERKTKTSEMFLGGKDWRDYEDNDDVRDVIRIYISLEYSQNEWTYQQLKNDIDDIKGRINEIPTRVYVDFDKDVDVKTVCDSCGEDVVKSVHIKQTIEFDSMAKRMDALKDILKLQDMEEKFREIIIRERKMNEHNQNNSLTLIEQGLSSRR